MKLLLKEGADPHEYLDGLGTPLCCAVLADSVECLQLLLEKGANPLETIENKPSYSKPIHFAATAVQLNV